MRSRGIALPPCLGFDGFRGNGKENGYYYNGLYRDYIGIMEKKMETTASSSEAIWELFETGPLATPGIKGH